VWTSAVALKPMLVGRYGKAAPCLPAETNHCPDSLVVMIVNGPVRPSLNM